jgi:hypothetical protein
MVMAEKEEKIKIWAGVARVNVSYATHDVVDGATGKILYKKA